MTFWFWPETYNDERREAALASGSLMLDAGQFPDLRKLLGPDQLAGGLARQYPDFFPEELRLHTDMLWHLSHTIEQDDFIVVSCGGGKRLMVGEVTKSYHYEKTEDANWHILSVNWRATDILTEKCPAMTTYIARGMLEEIQEPALSEAKNQIPSLRRSGPVVFKWISVIILLFELAYFWPH